MSVHHTRRGSGEPLVLVHGLGGTHRIWNPVLDRLASSREVIALDLPGFGGSPELASGTPPTPANLAAAVASFCRRIGVERPHVAGNSLGGWVALEMGRLGAATSVTALSPAGMWRRPLGPQSIDVQRLGRTLRPLLNAMLATRRGRAALLRSTVARPDRVGPAEARAVVRDWLDASAYVATNRQMRAQVFESPHEVRVPVTIAWGDRDRLVAQPRPERAPPGARHLVLEGCGHTPTWDDPERVAGLLLETSEPGGRGRAPNPRLVRPCRDPAPG